MIDENIRFEGFDAASWSTLVALFTGPPEHERTTADPETPAAAARGNLVVVVGADARPLAAFTHDRGAIPVEEIGALDDLASVAARTRVRRVLVLADGAMETLSERAAAQIPLDADYATQWLALLGVVRHAEREGLLRVWPARRRTPLPTPGMLNRALDLALPDDRSLLVVLWDAEHVCTGLAVRRHAGAIDRIVGPRMILDWAGPLSGDLLRDHRRLEHAVSERLAPVHLGVFAEREVAAALLRNPDPGAWARAVAVREILLQPAPTYAHAAVVADAVRGAAQWTGRWLAGVDLGAYAEPLTRAGRSRLGRAGNSIADAVGFDPLAAIVRRIRGSDRD